MIRLTAKQLADAGIARPKTKFKNVKVVVDGTAYDSKWEATCGAVLRQRQAAGEIRHLEVHQRTYQFVINGVTICRFIPDFTFEERVESQWVFVVADAKSAPTRTASYRIKIKLMRACYGLTVRELVDTTRHRRPRRVKVRPVHP